MLRNVPISGDQECISVVTNDEPASIAVAVMSNRLSFRSHGLITASVMHRTQKAKLSHAMGWEYAHVEINDVSREAHRHVLPDKEGIRAIAFLRAAAACYAELVCA
jgi:hypothetical protein